MAAMEGPGVARDTAELLFAMDSRVEFIFDRVEENISCCCSIICCIVPIAVVNISSIEVEEGWGDVGTGAISSGSESESRSLTGTCILLFGLVFFWGCSFGMSETTTEAGAHRRTG
jgi:hypothetical protein